MQAFCNIQYLGKGYRKTEWNRVSVFGEATDNETHRTEYAYDADNRVTQVKYDGSDSTKVNYSYDKLNRVTQRTVTNGAA